MGDGMNTEWEMDRLQDENAALRAEFKAACESANDLQLLVEDLQPKLERITAERDELQAWKDAVPMEAWRLYWRNSEWLPADDSDCTGDEARAASQEIFDWLATLDGAA